MPLGKESKSNLEKVIQEGSEIYIETNEYEKNNSSGRIIGYAYATYEDKIIQLNEMQVEDGFARVSDNLAGEVDIVIVKENYNKLLEFEKNAKEKKINIWNIENFVTDEGYDKKYNK